MRRILLILLLSLAACSISDTFVDECYDHGGFPKIYDGSHKECIPAPPVTYP